MESTFSAQKLSQVPGALQSPVPVTPLQLFHLPVPHGTSTADIPLFFAELCFCNTNTLNAMVPSCPKEHKCK